MKHLKLFLALFALVGVNLTANAQTDVTADYVVNPGFEDCTARTDNLAASGSASGDNYADAGWTLAASAAWSSSAVVAYGGSGQVNGASAPSADNAGNSGKTLGVSVGWGGTNKYQSTTAVTLPAGHYELKVYAYNNLSGVNQFQSVFGFVPTSGSSYLSTKKSYTYGTWEADVVTFDLTEATEGKFQIGGTAISGGSGSNAKVFFDNITLTYTDPLQAAKSALQAEIDKAELCDAKEGLADAIAAAKAVLTNATTEQELADALATLQAADKDAVLRYENGLANAAATNGMLTTFVVNGTFTDNVNGWTCTGGFQNQARANNQDGDFTKPFFENWNGSAQVNKMYQIINNIPNGTYKLKIAAFVNNLADPNESQFVFANNDKTYLTTGSPTFYEVWTVVENNTVEIGLEQTTATANWMGIDNVSLTYYGAGDVISQAQNAGHKADWDAALAAAQAAVANTDYANVTGEELANLNEEIAKAEPTTAEGYDEATAALNAATKAFTDAKPSYDAFVAEKAYAETLGMTVSAESPSSAEKAVLGTNAIKEEEFAYVTDNFPQDFSEVYLATPTTNTFDALTAQHWSGESRSYFDFWNGGSANRELTYVITLPAGRYIIKAAGRGQANSESSVTISDGTTIVPFVMKGDTGLGINKEGVTSFDPDDAAGFANNNAGRGWEWRYLLIDLDEEKEVTLSLNGHVNNSWIGACDFALLTTEDNTSINKAAYDAAVANANTALESEDYACVTGEELANLSAELEKEEPTTAQGYNEATDAIIAATTVFTEAKPSYDALIAAKAIAAAEEEEYPYASAEKKTAFETALEAANTTVTNAEDAAAKASALTTAQRTWVESNAMAEGVTDFEVEDYTNKIENARAQQGDKNAVVVGQAWGWTQNIERKTDQKPTYADGSTLNYLDGGNWNGSSWDIAVTQKISGLPTGKYLLTVTARAENDLTTFELLANDKTAALKHISADVNTGTFGRGYNDGFVVFEVPDANGQVTIGVRGVANSVHQWMSFTNFRLVKIAELDPASITIKAGRQYTAFSSDRALDFTNSELKAQIVISATGTTQDVTKVPANTGIIVGLAEPATEATTITVPVCADETDDVTGNLLVAVVSGAEIMQATQDYTNYVFGKKNGKEAFYKIPADGINVPANNAYLAVPTTSGAKEVIFLGGETTGISNVDADAEDGELYNLSGVKVKKAQKGVYIQNGKKVIVK